MLCNMDLRRRNNNHIDLLYFGAQGNVKSAVRDATNPYLLLEVRREHLIQDTLLQVSLKHKVCI